MRKKAGGGKTTWIVVAATLLVFGVLFAAFLSTSKGSSRGGITLPDAAVSPPEQPVQPDAGQAFLLVDAGNVQQTLKALKRPDAYHQTLTSTLAWTGGSGLRTVELWCSGALIRAQITQTGEKRYVLSNGADAWVWYEGDQAAAQFPLDEGRTLDDLIGVASYDTVMGLDPAQIEAAAFGPTEDDETVNCITLTTVAGADGAVHKFWIDAATQLLRKTQILQKGEAVYTLQQTGFEQLESNDATLTALFTLPNGQKLIAE